MRSLLTLVATVALTLAPAIGVADGVFVVVRSRGERETRVSSSAQRALLVWRAGKETLHLRSTYEGPAADFAWVVPVPARPTVSQSSWELFTQVEEATRPRLNLISVTRHKSPCTCAAGQGAAETVGAAETAVALLESLEVAEFHVDIVHARDGGGFVSWLRARDYGVDEKAAPVFQQYVDREFYFVAVRIREGAVGEAAGGEGVVSGGLTPLAISFETASPFYPLAVSAISSAPENELLLLTVTPWRAAPDGWDWAWLTDHDVQAGLGGEVLHAWRKSQGGCGSGKEQTVDTPAVDFAPAVRAAQQGLRQPALVRVCEIGDRWPLRDGGAEGEAGSESTGQRIVLTRFHAFLKPKHMRDLTLLPIRPRDEWPDGPVHRMGPEARPGRTPQDYYIEVSGAPSPRPVQTALAAVGLALAAVGMSRRRGGLRSAGLLLLLAAMAIGV